VDTQIIVALLGGTSAVVAATITTARRNDRATTRVINHLDNGLHATLKRLDAKLSEVGITVDAVVKTQSRPIMKTEPSGALLYANPAAIKLLGMTNAELSGNGWVKAVHPDDRAMVFDLWRECVVHRREFGPVMYRYRHPADGTVTWVEAVAIPTLDIDGEIVSWVATVLPVPPPET
jgi:PAS domain S-box-containing protein